VPTLYAALNARMEAGDFHVSHRLRRCVSAGEALPEEVGRKWRDFSGCDILDGVGSTEMLHIFLSNRPEDVVYGTSGTAVPGYELRLVDESGGEVAEGAIGELLVKGDSAALDYFGRRAQSRSTFEGHWTRTGDKYEKLANGRFRYCGRTDDMFKVSGVWVSPFEVEQALVAHPSVLEAAVVAQRDGDGLEKPKAYVVLKPGASPQGLIPQLQEHVKSRIGLWKYPRWIEFCAELPKTATGKIQRFKLRE
jgi:4-hydroxybenzoate-CoA ligase